MLQWLLQIQKLGKSTEVVQVNTPEVSLGSPNETGDEAKPDTIEKI